jgi:hypothetical protein
MDPFFLFISFLIINAGLYWIISDYDYSKNGYHTKGTVIKIIGKWSAIGGTFSYLYYPIVQFKSESDQELELKLEVGASFPLYYTGQSVKIIYYKDKIHPAGAGWKIFYWTVLVIGLGIGYYQISELVNSDIWDSLGVVWQVLRIIF